MHLWGDLDVHLFEFAVQVELPPVKVVGEEGVIVCAAVAGVGQDVTAAFGEAQEDVSGRRMNSRVVMDSWTLHVSSIYNCPIPHVVAWLLACWMKQGGGQI